MELDWVLVAVAFGVGALVGLTGVGAGAIMTPVLVGFFGVSLPVAIATDLVFATITKLIGVPFHHRQGSINWSLAGRMWLGSIPGALIGVAIVLFVVSREQTEWLVWPLIAIVFITALNLGFRAFSPVQSQTVKDEFTPPRWGAATLGGFGIGSAVAVTSVGAGVLGMALLVRVSPPRVKPQELVGTDLVHAIPIALVAGLAYGAAGFISWPLLFTMIVGSAPGIVVGSMLAGQLSSRALMGGLSILLFAIVVSMVGNRI